VNLFFKRKKVTKKEFKELFVLSPQQPAGDNGGSIFLIA
jgi:hypothetical protein